MAHSPVTTATGPTYADTVYYTVPSGAGVFSVGTMGWNKAVRGVDRRSGTTPAAVAFAQQVTDTLLTAMTAGPLGRTHPAVPNLTALHEATTTATGTGGPLDTTTNPHTT